MKTRIGLGAAAIAVVFAMGATEASAQDRDPAADGVRRAPAVVLRAGHFGAEADSLDAGLVVGVGFELPLSNWAMLRPSVARRTVGWPSEDRAEWLLDFGAQFERRVGDLYPFVGVSLGALFDLRDERAFTEEYVVATYGTMAGARWEFSDRLGIRGEAHWRWIDGFEHGALSTTAGLALRF